MLRILILCALLLQLSGPAQADQAGAKAAYQRGAQALAAKDYAGAAAEFEASLREDPAYYFSHKQAGTSYYYLGDKAKALEHYEAYLAKAPSDAQVAGFARSLRSTLGAAPAAPATPAAGALRTGFGLRLGLGWGFGRALNRVGTDVSNSYGESYPVSLGEGFVYDVEALWAFSPNWELGLGTSSMSFAKSFSSKSDLGSRPENSTKIEAGVIPILVMLYGRLPVNDAFTGIVGFGPSYGMGGSGTETSETKYANGSVDKSTAKVTTDGGLGYRGYLGGEWALSRMFSVYFGLELHDINLSPSKQVIESTTTDSQGRTTYTQNTNIEYVATAAKETTAVTTSSTTVSGGTWTNVSTYDDGVSNRKTTTTMNLSTGFTSTKAEITQKAVRNDTMNWNRVAPLVGVTMRF